MRSIDGLEVYLRVPVRVEQDDDVCLVQVDANTTSPRGQNEYFLLTLRILKVVNANVTFVCGRLPVDAAILVTPNTKHIVQNVHQLCHLAEDEYLAIFANKFRDQVV